MEQLASFSSIQLSKQIAGDKYLETMFETKAKQSSFFPIRGPYHIEQAALLSMTLADLGGRARRAPPLRVQILSF